MAIYATSTDYLLAYGVKTEPPLLTAGHDSGAIIITCGAKSGTTAFCDKIVVRVPVGSGPGDLSDTGPAAGITPDLDDTGIRPDSWDHSAMPVSGGKREFVFKNGRDKRTKFDGRNLILILKKIPVNQSTGNVTIEIDEYSAPTDVGTTKRPTTVPVRKAPEGFEFHSFHPMKMMVPNGKPAELTWVGSPAEYTMYWGLDSEATMDPKDNPPWTSPENLTNTTGYMLQAKVESPNGPMFFTQTCVVSVEKPDLEIGKLDVWGKATLYEGLEVQGQAKIFHKRPIVPRELEAGFNIIAPTDGFLTMNFPSDGDAVFQVYTQAMYSTMTLDSGNHTFPVNAGSQLFIKRISGNSVSVRVAWFSMGTSPLPIATAADS